MRGEKEMFKLILDVAERDSRVRAVYMNGSRTNPNVAKDAFRDYDVVYVVTETMPYIENPNWISVFGEVAIVQEPDRNDLVCGAAMDFSRSFTWLTLFSDGNRIDLHIETVDAMRETYGCDTLTVPLLDKDGLLPELPPASDAGYTIPKPSEEHYHAAANEFWWCLNNVAKGIVREQLPYTMWMYESVVRPALARMTEWYIGMRHGFQVTTGAHGKYSQKYLPESLYAMYVKTYAGGNYTDIWNAVFTACTLFGILARKVASGLGYTYCEREEEGTLSYLRGMRDGTFRLEQENRILEESRP